MVVLFAWIAVIFKYDLMKLLDGRLPIVGKVIGLIERFENSLELFLGFLALLLAAYTGFLLSALQTFPLLNNPILPILFLFSSLSSGAAACLLFGVLVFKESVHSACVGWIHKFERPVVMFELFVLFAFFIGLYFGGGQSQAAAMAAIGGGFWATWFWYGGDWCGNACSTWPQCCEPCRSQT